MKLLLNTSAGDDPDAAAAAALSLSSPILANLQKEASMMAALRHPAIVVSGRAPLGGLGRREEHWWKPRMVAAQRALRPDCGAPPPEPAKGRTFFASLALRESLPPLLTPAPRKRRQATFGTGRAASTLQGFLGVCPYPPVVVTEYAANGSLYDVLRAARTSPAKAAKLTWHRRLSLVGATSVALPPLWLVRGGARA